MLFQNKNAVIQRHLRLCLFAGCVIRKIQQGHIGDLTVTIQICVPGHDIDTVDWFFTYGLALA